MKRVVTLSSDSCNKDICLPTSTFIKTWEHHQSQYCKSHHSMTMKVCVFSPYNPSGEAKYETIILLPHLPQIKTNLTPHNLLSVSTPVTTHRVISVIITIIMSWNLPDYYLLLQLCVGMKAKVSSLNIIPRGSTHDCIRRIARNCHITPEQWRNCHHSS